MGEHTNMYLMLFIDSFFFCFTYKCELDSLRTTHLISQSTRSAYSEISNQSVRPHSLIRVLVFRLNDRGPITAHRVPIEHSDQTARMRRLGSEYSM